MPLLDKSGRADIGVHFDLDIRECEPHILPNLPDFAPFFQTSGCHQQALTLKQGRYSFFLLLATKLILNLSQTNVKNGIKATH
jgi:hypothetical protein